MAAGLQQGRGAPNGLTGAVAGGFFERRIDRADNAVRIGNHDAFGGALDHAFRQAAGFFRLPVIAPVGQRGIAVERLMRPFDDPAFQCSVAQNTAGCLDSEVDDLFVPGQEDLAQMAQEQRTFVFRQPGNEVLAGQAVVFPPQQFGPGLIDFQGKTFLVQREVADRRLIVKLFMTRAQFGQFLLY